MTSLRRQRRSLPAVQARIGAWPGFRTSHAQSCWPGAAATTGSPALTRALSRPPFAPRVRRDSQFKGRIVVCVLNDADHRFGSKPVANGIASGLLLALFRCGAGTEAGIATIGFDLAKRRHPASG